MHRRARFGVCGLGKSSNADSNSPFTLSNTLPLNKSEYREYLPEISVLRKRVGHSKRPTVAVAPTEGRAEQLQKLAGLRDSGILSDEEFGTAKARLLA